MNDVEVLITTEAIRTLQARYARYADQKNWSALADLFTPDGTFTPLDPEGNAIMAMRGRQEIEDQLAAAMAGDVTPLHQLFTAEIDVLSPTSARAVWSMADVVYRDGDASSQAETSLRDFRVMRGWGHYHNEYRKCDDDWLISRSVQTRTRLEFE